MQAIGQDDVHPTDFPGGTCDNGPKLFKEQGFGEEFMPVCSMGDRMGRGIR